MKQRSVLARSIVVVMAGALLVAALIAPVAAKESPKELKQTYKYVKGKLSKGGTINAPKNPLNWTQLMNVPAGLADGNDAGTGIDGCPDGSFISDIDDDGTSTCGTPQAGGGGDITSVTAGNGLTGGGVTGDVSLAVDETVFQRRLTGQCGFVQEVAGAAANGAIQCVAEPYNLVFYDSDANAGTNNFASTTFSALPDASFDFSTEGMTLDITLQVTFSAESVCYGGAGGQWCSVRIMVNGQEALPSSNSGGFAFDSTSAADETFQSWEGHSMTRTLFLDDFSGNGTVTVEARSSSASTTLGLNFWNLSGVLSFS